MFKLPIQARREFSPIRARYWLIVITLISAILRFFRLGFPSARTDEGFTYWRTCGTFGQLFDTLRLDAFVPLHYELVWLLTKILGHGLWVYRLPGAIFGTLMPIATYLLARTIFGRRVSIIAAAIAMSSAYFSFYARDAKMYMPAWCLTTFATASAFAFIKSGGRVHILKYIFFGIAAAGSHSLTLLPLAIIPLAGIAIRGHHKFKRIAITILGLVFIGIGPLIYYQTFNRWFAVSGGLSGVPKANIEEAPHDNGLMWVDDWQQQYGAVGVLLQSISAYLFGFEYPHYSPEPDPQTWGDYQAHRLYRASLITLAIISLIAFTTRLIIKGKSNRGRYCWIAIIMIALPLYGFYLRSFTTFAAPWKLMTFWQTAMISIVVALFVLRNQKRSMFWLISGLAVMVLAWGVTRFAYAHAPRLPDGSVAWNHLWMPRYAAIIAPMLLIAVAAMLDRLPTRLVRWSAISGFVIVNLLGSVAVMIFPTGWPDDQIARDAASTIGQEDTIVAANFVQATGKYKLYPIVTRAYNLVVEAGIEVDPPSFRTGNQWPYAPGPAIEPLQKKMRLINWFPSPSSPRFPDKVNHVIIWLREVPNSKPEWEIPGWKRIHQDEYTIRAAWNWHTLAHLQRAEYIRESK